MTRVKHIPKIMKILSISPKTFDELQKEIGKDIDIRYSIKSLLKSKKIVISGYNIEKKNFNHHSVEFKKVNPNIFNQIHIKNLIENAHIEKNFIEIKETFKKKIIKVNEAYQSDKSLLENIVDKMPIKEALSHIKSQDFNADTNNKPKDNELFTGKLEEYDNKYPNAQIWYFKENRIFTLELKRVLTVLGGPPIYPVRPYIDKDGSMTKDDFIRFYYRTFDYLPIYPNFIDELFDKLIKYALRIKIDKREDYQWELAELLSNDATVKKFAYFINNFLEKIENEDYVNPEYMEDPFL
jgi:hypothetical protein